ncbi:hypothetical protein PPACK8108_LOCUS22545 [Phakopsora pachyrhizi]|uniref:Uncharacterized protein n=1 Tax=Phakopsora pachyrhizi TaxID=170000 RepID=A0AAV0BNG4_PHAPC|nr:hypothetical protein PPACK8108_LOCUS22545 [Phakopsora pachyrhizi]
MIALQGRLGCLGLVCKGMAGEGWVVWVWSRQGRAGSSRVGQGRNAGEAGLIDRTIREGWGWGWVAQDRLGRGNFSSAGLGWGRLIRQGRQD